MSKSVGVLALQGGVREHVDLVGSLGAQARLVRRPADLGAIDGLIIPGGESAVISRLAETFGLFEPMTSAIASGLPVLGTCAGLILLAGGVEGAAPGQKTFGGLDITVQRNAFGSQRASFDTAVHVEGVGRVEASFIRAPLIVRVGANVSIIATLDDESIVGVRSGSLIGVSFHPEVARDASLHRHFLSTL